MDFQVEDVDVALHNRVAAAIAKGHFTSHNMRESELDSDQDLTLWLRSLKEVLREDLSNAIADVLVKSLEWNMLSREWNLSVSDLSKLHQLSKGLLDALNNHVSDRS